LIRIWVAGCSTGEEAYSVAILLKEAGLYHKCLIYATDINPSVLETASSGVFPLQQMKVYSENYILSGGKKISQIIIQLITTVPDLIKA
jgi:chemotaxis protein methyltransferase CheR